MVLKLRRLRTIRRMWFENDVKMYGTQTPESPLNRMA